MDDALRVLLVDDEKDYLQTTAKIFRRKGINAELCNAGRDAVALLQEKKCQVVVLDLKMPGMAGQEVLREIKTAHPFVQVIILTGHATSEDAADCLTSGAFDFLIKPVEMDQLIDRIKTAYELWKVSLRSRADGGSESGGKTYADRPPCAHCG
jgi:DNA-binding NtrC family response regulator